MLKLSMDDLNLGKTDLGCCDCEKSAETAMAIWQKKFDEWLSKQPKAYAAVPNNSLWMKCSEGSVPSTYKHACYLIPVEEK